MEDITCHINEIQQKHEDTHKNVVHVLKEGIHQLDLCTKEQVINNHDGLVENMLPGIAETVNMEAMQSQAVLE